MKTNKLTLHFFTCMHGRTDVAEIFLRGLYRIMIESYSEFDMKLYVAHSDDEDDVLCKDFAYATGMDITTAKTQNDLIGSKWNTALNMAMAGGKADYYIKIDDDDVVSSQGFAQMLAMMSHKVPYIGFDHVLFMDGTNGDGSLFKYPNPNKVLGAIRAFSWEMLHAGVVHVLCEIMQQVTQDGAKLEPGEQRWLNYNLAGWLHTQGIVRVMGNEDGTLITRCRLWTNEWNRSLDWDSDVRLALKGIVATPVPVDLDTQMPCVIDIKTPGQNIWSFGMRSNDGKPFDTTKINWLSNAEKTLITQLQISKMQKV